MLILIAGVTGNLGRELHIAALQRGHQVRGLGRSAQKFHDGTLALESFVVCADYLDQSAYERACAGVDIVIPAWNQDPKLVLDAQLLLLRAAEKAGVKRFHGMSWGMDWTKLQLGDLSPYDPYLCFGRQARLTSVIRPCFTFTGGFANSMFGRAGTGAMTEDKSMWIKNGDPSENKRTIKVLGKDSWKLNWVAEADAADFTVALMESDDGEKGGYYRFSADIFSARLVKEAFERARGPGAEVKFELMMDVNMIETAVDQTRKALKDATPAIYLSKKTELDLLEYSLHMAMETGLFEPVDAEKFAGVKRTTMEEFIRQNEWV